MFIQNVTIVSFVRSQNYENISKLSNKILEEIISFQSKEKPSHNFEPVHE